MQLIKYRVNKFRSIKGTEWIDIDQWACFVGVNESGKTNLLLPLWKFNPADDATSIDLLHDYPRDEYSAVGDDASGIENDFFVETLFEISPEDAAAFEGFYQEAQAEESEEENSEEDAETVTQDNKPEKVGFKQYLLIKKDYKERFHIYLSNENGEAKSEELEDVIGESAFEKICDAIPKFV